MDFQAALTIDGGGDHSILLIADHAMARVPDHLGQLGLSDDVFEKHVSHDIGVDHVTRHLARMLDAPAVLCGYSRLVIDPNRSEDDPTVIRQIYDGIIIPENRDLDDGQRAQRFALYDAYHGAVAREIARIEQRRSHPPFVISIHSFTPALKDGRMRPWQIGLLSDLDRRATDLMLDALKRQSDLIVGDNEPYDGALFQDTMYRHCSSAGLPHLLIELRQDLIADESGAKAWAERLAPLIASIAGHDCLATRRRFGSRVGPLEKD